MTDKIHYASYHTEDDFHGKPSKHIDDGIMMLGEYKEKQKVQTQEMLFKERPLVSLAC